MTKSLLIHDLRLLGRDGSLLLAILVLAAALLYGLSTGIAWKSGRLAAIEATAIAAAEESAAARADLAAITEDPAKAEALPRAGLPTSVSSPAIKPPGVLAELGIGQEDVLPFRAKVSAWDRTDNLFRRYQLDNPLQLAAGRFDVAFVILYLLPLLLMFLCCTGLATERDAGIQRLLFSQPVSVRRVLWTRVTVRSLVLFAVVALVVPLVLLIAGAGVASPGRLPALVKWLFQVFLYVAAWAAIAGLIVAANRSLGQTAALALMTWLLLVILIPGAVNTIIQVAHPPPSRPAYIATLRAAEIRASQDASRRLAAYMHDHPELAGGEGADSWVKTYFLSQRVIENGTASELHRFELALDAQRRLLSWLRFISPTLVAQQLLGETTGTSLARHQAYTRATREFKQRWNATLEPLVMSGRKLNLTTFDSMPRFEYRDTVATHTGVAIDGLLALLFYIVGAAGLAHRRLRRFRPDG